MSQLADQAFPPDPPRYGGSLDVVMSALRLPLPSAICMLRDHYWWLEDGGWFAFVPLAQHHIASGDLPTAERLAHEFDHTASPLKPVLPPERKLRWWRRLWWWATP